MTDGVFFFETGRKLNTENLHAFLWEWVLKEGGGVVVKILAWKLWKLGLIDMVTTDVTTTGQAIIILGSNAVIVHVTPFDPFYFSFDIHPEQCGDQL